MTQKTTNNLGKFSPRGERRIVYVSDPSSIARRYLPDPTTEEDLRNWIDEVARARVDTFIQEAYTQGWTTYWRGDHFDYDARPQHRRFLPLLDAGVQPLEVLLDQSHKNGMEFMAGLRINDNHGHVSKRQGVGAGAGFLADNPQWTLKETPPGPYYKLSTPLDFTFSEVRDYVFSVAAELIETFDLDGLELCFRDQAYFPPNKGRESQPLMTELVARIRALLQEKGAGRNKDLLLGARVYATLEECHNQGLDVPTWIGQGLLDYVAPADTMYSEINAPYEEFAALTRASNCMLYPGMLPWSSIRARRRLADRPISLEQQRALAQNFYGAGADGFSSYNHFVAMHWAPFYPMMLQDLDEVREPERLTQGRRHYVFEPILAGSIGFGKDRAETGAIKADKIVLERQTPNAAGQYRLRICEDLSTVRRASLLFRGFHMTANDQVEVRLNNTLIPPRSLRRRSDEARPDALAPVDIDTKTSLGLPLVPDPEGPFSTCSFDLQSPPAVYGDNYLEVKLIAGDPDATEAIVIDEIEVLVIN
jgi:hypothetical protein